MTKKRRNPAVSGARRRRGLPEAQPEPCLTGEPTTLLHPARHFADAVPARTIAADTTLPGGLFVAGTRVETAAGWRDVAALSAGDALWTFDGGLRPLVAVERQVLSPEAGRMAVLVPGGLMGACADLMLLSSTGVLLGTGDRRPKMARALVPARALRALPGVTLRPAGGRIEAVRLVFAEEEAIWANTGVLVHCPRGDTSQFPRLEAAVARAMLTRQAAHRRAA